MQVAPQTFQVTVGGQSVILETGKAKIVSAGRTAYKVLIRSSSLTRPTKAGRAAAEGAGYHLEYVAVTVRPTAPVGTP